MDDIPRASRRCPSCGARVRGTGTACAACGARLPWRLTLGGVVMESALAVGLAFAAIGGLLWWRSGGHVALPDGGTIGDLVARAPTDVPTPTPEPPATATRPPNTPFPPTPTPLPEVIEHTIASGDTLFGLGLEHGVTLDDIRAANPEIDSLDRLQIGQVIRIPVQRPEPAEAPEGAEAEAVAQVPPAEEPAPADAPQDADADPPADSSSGEEGAPEGAQLPAGDGAAAATAIAMAAPTGIPIVVSEAVTHAIQSGDTLGGLAVAYEAGLDDLIAWNDLVDPNENLPIGRELVVKPEVVVTATPLPVPERMAQSASGGASDPSLPAEEGQAPLPPQFTGPVALSPAEGAGVSGDPPLLRWTSAGVLPPGHFYVIAVRDARDADAKPRLTWVRGSATALRLPPRWRPAVGASRTLAWSVTVRRESTGLLAGEGVIVSGEPVWHTFVWTPRGEASAAAPTG